MEGERRKVNGKEQKCVKHWEENKMKTSPKTIGFTGFCRTFGRAPVTSGEAESRIHVRVRWCCIDSSFKFTSPFIFARPRYRVDGDHVCHFIVIMELLIASLSSFVALSQTHQDPSLLDVGQALQIQFGRLVDRTYRPTSSKHGSLDPRQHNVPYCSGVCHPLSSDRPAPNHS